MGVGRELSLQVVHTKRKTYAYSDLTSGTAVTLCTLPAGAVVYDAFAIVSTAFNSGTSDTLEIGTSGDPNGFMSAVSIATAGKISADDLATSDDLGPYASETDIKVEWTGTGTAATAGSMEVCLMYIVDNDE